MTLQHTIGEQLLEGITETDRKVIVKNGEDNAYIITEQVRYLKSHAPTEWDFYNNKQYVQQYNTQDATYESYDVELCMQDIRTFPWSQEDQQMGR